MRPAWDIVMIVLLLGGLISSSIGLVLGFSRVAAALDARLMGVVHDGAPAPTTPLQERDA